MKNIGKSKIILTVGTLTVFMCATTLVLVNRQGHESTEKPSSVVAKKLDSTLEKNSSRKEAGRDSFPDNETYEQYKNMRHEVSEGELIIDKSNPETPNQKNFIGTKSEIKIENWSLEKDEFGDQFLKVPFTFINKTNDAVNIKEYLKNRITAQQMTTETLNSLMDLRIEEYPAIINVGAKESYSGFINIQILKDKPNYGITFNVSYVSGGTNNKGGGVVLHDLKANPSF